MDIAELEKCSGFSCERIMRIIDQTITLQFRWVIKKSSDITAATKPKVLSQTFPYFVEVRCGAFPNETGELIPREFVRCPRCTLVQFFPRDRCSRCHIELVTNPELQPETSEFTGPLISAAQIGERIKHLRMASQMTQSELQARSRVSKSYLSRIESGNMTPSLGTIEKIAAAVGITLGDFFRVEPDNFVQTINQIFPRLGKERRREFIHDIQGVFAT